MMPAVVGIVSTLCWPFLRVLWKHMIIYLTVNKSLFTFLYIVVRHTQMMTMKIMGYDCDVVGILHYMMHALLESCRISHFPWRSSASSSSFDGSCFLDYCKWTGWLNWLRKVGDWKMMMMWSSFAADLNECSCWTFIMMDSWYW